MLIRLKRAYVVLHAGFALRVLSVGLPRKRAETIELRGVEEALPVLEDALSLIAEFDPAAHRRVVRYVSFVVAGGHTHNWMVADGSVLFLDWAPSPTKAVVACRILKCAANAHIGRRIETFAPRRLIHPKTRAAARASLITIQRFAAWYVDTKDPSSGLLVNVSKWAASV